MTRIYTEIRIHHKSVEDKENFEKSLDIQSKAILGKEDRAEYIRFIENIQAATGIIDKLKKPRE